jgi:hypothetical protein
LDGGIFLAVSGGLLRLLLTIYVDDILLIGEQKLIEETKENLTTRFKMHDLGEASHYLGMCIERDRANRVIYISQHAYIESVLAKYGFDRSAKHDTPLDTKRRLHKRTPSEPAADVGLYQSMMGSLMYAMIATRPDLAFAVGTLSRFSHDPSEEHLSALKRVMRYLNKTKHWKLRLGGKECELTAYADASFANDPDDFRSTTGYVILLGGAIDWRSRKQKSTAQSTADAEYYAFGAACMRLTELKHLLHEMQIVVRPVIYCDNEATIKSVKESIFRGTLSAPHIGTKFFLAADMVREGHVRMEYVASADMLADGLTKQLQRPVFLEFCARLGLRDWRDN